PATPTTSSSRGRYPRRSAPPWADSSAGSARFGRRPHPLRTRANALARGRARPPTDGAPEAHAHPRGEHASRSRRRKDALLPAGILRPPDVRLDASGDARALIMERGRAGAVCRVHLPPEPMSLLNRCPRRGRVAGPEARREGRHAGRGDAGGLAYGAARPEAACHARLPRKAHARAHGGGVGGRETTPGCRREG